MTKGKPPFPFLVQKLLELTSLDVPKDCSFGINNVTMDSDRYLCIVDQGGINQSVQIVELIPSDRPVEIILHNQIPTAHSIGNLKQYDTEPFNLAAELLKFEMKQTTPNTPIPTSNNHINSHDSNIFSAAVSPIIHPISFSSLSKTIVSNVKNIIDSDRTESYSSSNSLASSSNTDIDQDNNSHTTTSSNEISTPQWPIKVHGRWPILTNDTVIAHRTSLTIPSSNTRITSMSTVNLQYTCFGHQTPTHTSSGEGSEDSFDYVEPKSGEFRERCTVAIKAAFGIQLFDLRLEKRIKTLKMNEGIRYWKFLDDCTIVLVSNNYVYHWNITSDDYPIKLFALLEELQTSQIVNYKYDVHQQFSALFSISAQDNKVIGHIQLYSFSYKLSKLLYGFAGDFYTHEIPDSYHFTSSDHHDSHGYKGDDNKKGISEMKKEGMMGGKVSFNFFTHKKKKSLHVNAKKIITIFCFTNKLNNIISVERKLLNKHFFATKTAPMGSSGGSGVSNSSPKKIISKVKGYLDDVLNFKYSPTEFELTSTRLKDFPVSIYIIQNLAILFLVTKMGYCSIIEIFSGSFIYEQKISPQTVFLTTPVYSLFPSYYSFITVNRDGRVVAVVLNEKELSNVVIENTKKFSLALQLLKRDCNLEVALEHVLREFLHLLSARKFREAADLIVLKNTKSALRRLEIINKFLECDVYDKTPPVHFYFHSILRSYSYLLHFEAVVLVQEVLRLQNKSVAIKALDYWYSHGKLRPSQDIANLIKSIYPELASKIESRRDHQPIDFSDPSAPISDFSASLLSRLEEELAREKEIQDEKKETKEVEFSDFILESQSAPKETSHEEFDLFKHFKIL